MRRKIEFYTAVKKQYIKRTELSPPKTHLRKENTAQKREQLKTNNMKMSVKRALLEMRYIMIYKNWFYQMAILFSKCGGETMYIVNFVMQKDLALSNG